MKYELLSPAGNLAMFKAAVDAGADSVYFGLKHLNMRDSAKNFSLSDLDKIKKFDVRKYLTLNTIIYDSEINKVKKILDKIKNKVDAVICWDLSVLKEARKRDIEVHLSTQASVANSEAAKFFKELDVKRIILARELNLKQIKKISRVIDVECFIHGAMCVSISGRCFISQELFNQSANRGKCLQPCRREYKIKDEGGRELRLGRNYVMSVKDLCSLPFIEKLKKSGIKAFKIEGRNRSVDYVDAATRVYREALDNKLTNERVSELLAELKGVYNRKFSSGFFLGVPSNDDFTDVRGSDVKEPKKQVGRVINYYKKKGVMAVEVLSGNIRIGDELMVIGNKTGIVRVNVESMELEPGKCVREVGKGELVGILVSKEVRKGDLVFKKKT